MAQIASPPVRVLARTAIALLASFTVHSIVLGVVWLRGPVEARRGPEPIVELAVVQPAPPPEPEPELTPEPQEPRPRPPVSRRAPRTPIKAPPVEAPPPPTPEPPTPTAAPPDPQVGVTAETVTEGPSKMVVPVGNTIGGVAQTSKPQPAPAKGYVGGVAGGTGATPFAPVAEGFVKQWPRLLNEVQAPFTEEARRLDVSGTVRLRVGIDETGKVREVKVLKRVGYGLDEAAAKAMWRFKFSPAVDQDGRPVSFRINWDYIFTPAR